MKRWIDLEQDRPWDRPKKPKKRVTYDDYMQPGWDQTPSGCHPYKKGSRHNKIGMWIMWTYYVLFTGMVIRLIWALNT